MKKAEYDRIDLVGTSLVVWFWPEQLRRPPSSPAAGMYRDVTANGRNMQDDSCLVLEPGHLSYSQKQPKTEMPRLSENPAGQMTGCRPIFAPAVSGKTSPIPMRIVR
ncbi:MAG: hypothetical protein ACLSUW_07620 [Akkermansia sp.]